MGSLLVSGAPRLLGYKYLRDGARRGDGESRETLHRRKKPSGTVTSAIDRNVSFSDCRLVIG